MATWYAAPEGAGSANGTTSSDPWALPSVVWGKNGVRPGDTLILLDGTYTAPLLVAGIRGDGHRWTTVKAQTTGGVLFEGWDTLERNGVEVSNCSFVKVTGISVARFGLHGVFLTDSHKVILDSLSVTHCGYSFSADYYGSGIQILGRSATKRVENVVIRKCTVSYSKAAGIHVAGWVRNVVVLRCHAHHNAAGTALGHHNISVWAPWDQFPPGTTWSPSIQGGSYYVSRSAFVDSVKFKEIENAPLCDQVFWSGPIDGVNIPWVSLDLAADYQSLGLYQYAVSPDPSTGVDRVYVRLNGSVSPSVGTLYCASSVAEKVKIIECLSESVTAVGPQEGTGIQLDNSVCDSFILRCRVKDCHCGIAVNVGRRNTVAYNVVSGSTLDPAALTGFCDWGIEVFNSLDTRVFGNTVYKCRQQGIGLWNRCVRPQVINNIVHTISGLPNPTGIGGHEDYFPGLTSYHIGAVIDNNCVYNCVTPFGAWTPPGANNITTDPKLGNPDAEDFSISGASPCLGTGASFSSTQYPEYMTTIHPKATYPATVLTAAVVNTAPNIGAVPSGSPKMTIAVTGYPDSLGACLEYNYTTEVDAVKLIGTPFVTDVMNTAELEGGISVISSPAPASIDIRGSASSFLPDAGSPAWEAYSSEVTKSWSYVQLKLNF